MSEKADLIFSNLYYHFLSFIKHLNIIFICTCDSHRRRVIYLVYTYGYFQI